MMHPNITEPLHQSLTLGKDDKVLDVLENIVTFDDPGISVSSKENSWLLKWLAVSGLRKVQAADSKCKNDASLKQLVTNYVMKYLHNNMLEALHSQLHAQICYESLLLLSDLGDVDPVVSIANKIYIMLQPHIKDFPDKLSIVLVGLVDLVMHLDIEASVCANLVNQFLTHSLPMMYGTIVGKFSLEFLARYLVMLEKPHYKQYEYVLQYLPSFSRVWAWDPPEYVDQMVKMFPLMCKSIPDKEVLLSIIDIPLTTATLMVKMTLDSRSKDFLFEDGTNPFDTPDNAENLCGFRYFMRDTFENRISNPLISEYKTKLKEFRESPRVIRSSQVGTLLLELFFHHLSQLPAIDEQGVLKMLIECLPQVYNTAGYRFVVEKIISSEIPYLLSKLPNCLQNCYTIFQNFISSTENLSSFPMLYSVLLKSVGNHILSSQHPDSRLLQQYYDCLECILYEVIMLDLVQRSTLSQLISLSSCIAMISSKCQEILPRALLCLGKLLNTAQSDGSRKDKDCRQLSEYLRELLKNIKSPKSLEDGMPSKSSISACVKFSFDVYTTRYIPVLMAQAKIYRDLENYQQVEKIFRKSVEYCNDSDVWKLNVAHVLFMQENKFKEASGFYEPIVKKHYENILNVSAIVLANLCVSYIMTSQNEEAEELMRKIEREEEQVAFEDSEKKIFHLCIVNLVIGTLYCAKGNYEFGISRVIKSLEPYQKKLGTDTWFYAKRCFLSFIETLAKYMLTVRDSVLDECIKFLEHCEVYGKDVKTVIEHPLGEDHIHPGKNTVTYEARLLKALLLQYHTY